MTWARVAWVSEGEASAPSYEMEANAFSKASHEGNKNLDNANCVGPVSLYETLGHAVSSLDTLP